MSRKLRLFTDEEFSFPRVSGDEPTMWGTVSAYEVFSPRERG